MSNQAWMRREDYKRNSFHTFPPSTLNKIMIFSIILALFASVQSVKTNEKCGDGFRKMSNPIQKGLKPCEKGWKPNAAGTHCDIWENTVLKSKRRDCKEVAPWKTTWEKGYWLLPHGQDGDQCFFTFCFRTLN